MTSFLRKYHFTLLTANILLIYSVGIIGIITTNNDEERYLFMMLTPVNLLMNCIMLLSFHNKWDKPFVLTSIFIALSGFLIEVIGVKTGHIFGNYSYGNSLGFKIADVPVLMALNWFMLIYATAAIFSIIDNDYIFALLGAALITLLDTIIEPVCSFLHFWFWQDGAPLQNFTAWFIISFFLLLLFRKINGKITNRYGIVIMIMQFLFFCFINGYKYYILS